MDPADKFRHIPCRDLVGGGECARGDKCWFSHSIEKREPCRFFNTARGCRNGENCAYLHEFVSWRKRQEPQVDDEGFVTPVQPRRSPQSQKRW